MNKACSIFTYSRSSIARRLRVGIILLTSAGEVTPGTVFSLGPLKFKKHVEKPGAAKSDQCDSGFGVQKVEGSREMGCLV